jgi:hypothetical protein
MEPMGAMGALVLASPPSPGYRRQPQPVLLTGRRAALVPAAARRWVGVRAGGGGRGARHRGVRGEEASSAISNLLTLILILILNMLYQIQKHE